ncbi:LLM class flavin-dependent oxidoreductase [Quadrisphaera sp. RL12-1S]|nr:LLM class flavin-dependent oxidoreductase [Quadrisphaera sp. RL12-1S]
MDAAAPTQPWQDVPGAARRAEDAGLDSLWVGDHLALDRAPLLDAPMTLAATAAATSRIEVGTSVGAGRTGALLRQVCWPQHRWSTR